MTRLVIPATIHTVEERFRTTYKNGVGDKTEFEKVSLGRWIVIDNLAIHVGPDKPDFAKGEMIKLAIEKAS